MSEKITLGEMKECFDSYIEECADHEFSDNTITRYKRVARNIIDFMEKDHNNDDEIKKSDMIRWKKSIEEYAPESQKVFIVSANKFTRYCVTENIDDKNKCYLTIKNIRIQDAAQTADNVATSIDIERLMRVARKKGFSDIYIALEIITRTGIRFGAFESFTVEALKNRTIIPVKTKGKNIRVIIPQSTKTKINEYIKAEGIESGYILRARRDHEKPMSKSTFWDRLQKVAGYARVKKDVAHAHSFRHAFAKGMYEAGVPIATIADLLGHASIETTRRYLRLSTDEMKNVVNEINPYKTKKEKHTSRKYSKSIDGGK